jgi:endonuclease III
LSVTTESRDALAARAHRIHERLLAEYGDPTWHPPLEPVDELVSTILSQNTNDRNRDLAYNSLRARFPTWEQVRDAPAEEVQDAIRIAGLANQKGPRLQQVLREITAERGSLDINFLRELPTEEARQWLLKFNGVGPKTAAIVLQFSLGKPAFPVDTHVHRVTGRLGLRPENMNAEQAHAWFEELFRPEVYGPAHMNIIRLGRQVCHARNPNHAACPVADLCDYYQGIGEGSIGDG